jgi:hypothetical protein
MPPVKTSAKQEGIRLAGISSSEKGTLREVYQVDVDRQ